MVDPSVRMQIRKKGKWVRWIGKRDEILEKRHLQRRPRQQGSIVPREARFLFEEDVADFRKAVQETCQTEVRRPDPHPDAGIMHFGGLSSINRKIMCRALAVPQSRSVSCFHVGWRASCAHVS